MAEPQPSTVREGDTSASNPGNGGGGSADSRAAAAALSSLDADEPSAASSSGTSKRDIDTAALGDAIARLGVSGGSVGDQASSSTAASGKAAATATTTLQQQQAKKIKIDAADVALLGDSCDLSKPRATELLRAHDGDLGRALRGWVGLGVQA
ncbi:hypothetical protein ANO11243_013470 [Dothideomycetidae sp. 11243]|nr:hypothetical protein ANO11243_013470 [fungal sp. No.11243]